MNSEAPIRVNIETKSMVPVEPIGLNNQHQAGGILQRNRNVDLSLKANQSRQASGVFRQLSRYAWRRSNRFLLKATIAGLAVYATKREYVWSNAEQTTKHWKPLVASFDLRTFFTLTINNSVKNVFNTIQELPQSINQWSSKGATDVDKLMPTLLAMRSKVF